MIESPFRRLHRGPGRQPRNLVPIRACERVCIEHHGIARCGGHTLEMRCGVDSQNLFVGRRPRSHDAPACCRELTRCGIENVRALNPFGVPRRRDVFRELS